MKKSAKTQNIHGRRGGRGARPVLILGKLICVGCFLGGLAGYLAVILAAQRPGHPEQLQTFIEVTERFFTRIIIPAGIGAEIVGIFLLLSIWRVMIRMRWFQIKMVVLAIGMPGLHLFLRGRVSALETLPGDTPTLPQELHTHLLVGVWAGIAVAVVLTWLGRIKPRLGQNYGKTFAGRTSQTTEKKT